MIERDGNRLILTLPDERTAECLENLLKAFMDWMAIRSVSSTPETGNPPEIPPEPLKRHLPFSPATCAEIERSGWQRLNLREFDRLNPNPSGEAYLPPGRRK